MKLATNNIHLGVHEADPNYGSVVPPIYPSSTYIFPCAAEGALRFAGKSDGMIYSRFQNPTVIALEKRLAALEEGEKALATSSGMSAISLVFFHLLRSGDSVLAHNVLYGGTVQLLTVILLRFGIKVKLVNFNNLAEIKKNIDKTTKLIYFESPTNPMMEIIDIKKVTSLAKKHKITTVFDNTFAPPPLQYPLKLGIDIVVHSLTKYINGHSDVIAGAVIGQKKLLTEMYHQSFKSIGPCLSPFSAYLVLRGMETLSVRITQQCQSAHQIAKFLEKHPKVGKVYYPGLPSNSEHKLAKKQMSDFGSVLSFEVKGGYEAGERLVNNIKVIHLAVSLGAAESLIEHPASMTHAGLSAQQRKEAGLNDALIRLSVGLEDTEDLISALKQALK